MPKSILKIMKDEPGRLVLSGGFIRACIANEKISDIDLFSTSKDTAELFARRYMGDNGRMIETCNAYTIVERGKTAVQFIHRWTFDDPHKILPSFDFTIARAAIWFDGENWRGICDSRFYLDLAAKRLVYCSPVRIEEAGGSLLRVLKFYQRGYRIPLDSLAATIARCFNAVDFSKLSHSRPFEEELAFVLSGILREVDPCIDPTENAYFPMPSDLTDNDEKEKAE
jgi:hypothetical protein